MHKIKFVLMAFIATILLSQLVYAINKGDKVHYSVVVNNNSANSVNADGKVIPPNQSMVIAQYEDTATSSNLNISHSVRVSDSKNADICVVTGHLDFGPGSMSMYAENTNPKQCGKSNGMNSSTGFSLVVTVY